MPKNITTIESLRRSILDDIFKDFDHSRKWIRKVLEPLAWPSANRFAKISARFDNTVASAGFQEAMRELLAGLVSDVVHSGLNNIPKDGPLMILSNHPGVYDSVAIAANLPRDDLNIVATGYPLLRRLPNAKQHFIFMDPHSDTNISTVRKSILHLESGGAVLIFPRGRVEPDPAVLPGAQEAVQSWSPSVELFLRRVPQTQILVTIVSGVLSPVFLRNPLIKLWHGLRDPQTIAEVTQVLTQMLFSKWVQLTPKISFGMPQTVDELLRNSETLYQSIITEASQLLDTHIQRYSFMEVDLANLDK